MNSFNQIIKILEVSKDPLASECLVKMETETIHFRPGFFKDKNELTSLYKLRLSIAQSLNKDKFKPEELASWDAAVESLYKIDCRQIQLVTVNTEKKIYMIFVNADKNILTSMFFLYQKTSLTHLEEHYKEIKERGHSSSTLIYKQGKLKTPSDPNHF